MTSRMTTAAKKLLRNVDKSFVMDLIDSINMTSREKKILSDTELEKKTIKELSVEMNLSLAYISVLKRSAIRKVYEYGITTKLIKEQNNNTATFSSKTAVRY